MSDNGEVEVAPANYNTIPKDVLAESRSVKLFNKWSFEGVDASRDMSLVYVSAPVPVLVDFLVADELHRGGRVGRIGWIAILGEFLEDFLDTSSDGW
jgi:hypothetical protein